MICILLFMKSEKVMAPHSSTLAWKIHGQRGLVGCSPWVTKSREWLSDFTFTFHFHALEKEMATHSSVLAWRIPGTGKPGGLPSLGSHRVRHDWSDLAAAAAMRVQRSTRKDQKVGVASIPGNPSPLFRIVSLWNYSTHKNEYPHTSGSLSLSEMDPILSIECVSQ